LFELFLLLEAGRAIEDRPRQGTVIVLGDDNPHEDGTLLLARVAPHLKTIPQI
jgi:hypothetical protein